MIQEEEEDVEGIGNDNEEGIVVHGLTRRPMCGYVDGHAYGNDDNDNGNVFF